MKIKLLVDGGKMAPGPAVAQQLGPMGINLGKVIEDVNIATKDFSGTKVPVELDVDAKTKEYKISVSTPPTSELIKKEIGLERGSGEPNKMKVGNISIESLIKISKTKSSDLLSKDLKSSLKMMVGTCTSLGILVDNKESLDVQVEINDGHYDTEINEGRTEASPEKLEKLKKFFAVRKAKQDKDKKAEEEATAAAAESAEEEKEDTDSKDESDTKDSAPDKKKE